jgi:DNA-binding NarL/FixJ family response regulator
MLRKELLETIRAVHAGQKRVSSEVASGIAEHATDDTLTPREIDVVRLIAGGNANKEIATLLDLTEELSSITSRIFSPNLARTTGLMP